MLARLNAGKPSIWQNKRMHAKLKKHDSKNKRNAYSG